MNSNPPTSSSSWASRNQSTGATGNFQFEGACAPSHRCWHRERKGLTKIKCSTRQYFVIPREELSGIRNDAHPGG